MSLTCRGGLLVRQMLQSHQAMTLNATAFIHTCRPSLAMKKDRDRREMLKTLPKRDEGVVGESGLSADLYANKAYTFYAQDTPEEVFNGVQFKEVPIVHIKATKNNTHITLVDHKGSMIKYRTCGMEGFKNCRKGTNVAAQTTATTLSKIARKSGVSEVRVCVNGLGPGRMSSVKGLVAGGLNIISITDTTPFDDHPRRPPVAKSL